jgi:hypothetical protein
MTPDAKVFEHVHRLFGIGDWDELTSSEPYHQFRMREIAKIKARRTKLNVSADDLCNAADYCKAQHIDIRNVAWLYQHLGDARRWKRERERALAAREVDELLDEAIALETTVPDSRWLEQLIRARGPHRQEVYDAWKTWRDSQLTSSTSDLSGPAAASSAPTPP